MLVLGHVLALSPVVGRLIDQIVKPCKTSGISAAFVAFFTLIFGLFNWGLGLVFGAILARKVGEQAELQGHPINYPLVGAAGYSALMIWHGGLSGSSLIKVAEPGHLSNMAPHLEASILPVSMGLGETVFSPMNIVASVTILILLPALLFVVGKYGTQATTTSLFEATSKPKTLHPQGAEHLDLSPWFSRSIGLSILAYALWTMFSGTSFLAFFTPNNINLLLFGLCLSAHSSIHDFIAATDEAIVGASGILIQFPLYFGILGLMNESGLVQQISDFFIAHSNETTFPIFTFISAGLVNIFVPSGGGQWAIQGPVIIQSSIELGIPLNKSILALAYGDEITNMLQPFWALPLLGITKLKATEILPYTLLMFGLGSVIYSLALLIF